MVYSIQAFFSYPLSPMPHYPAQVGHQSHVYLASPNNLCGFLVQEFKLEICSRPSGFCWWVYLNQEFLTGGLGDKLGGLWWPRNWVWNLLRVCFFIWGRIDNFLRFSVGFTPKRSLFSPVSELSVPELFLSLCSSYLDSVLLAKL